MTQPPGMPDPSSAPQYGQPQYGQPQYEQPQSDQSQYGQSQYGQPPPPPPQQGGYPAPSGYGQPAQPAYGAPGGYPSAPPPGYGPVNTKAPSQVVTAAVLGFVAALFTLLATFGFFALSTLSGIFVLFALLYLAITVGLIAGGVMALTGKNGQILLITAAVATALQLLGIIIALAQGADFQVISLLGLLMTGGIVFLLMQPQAKQYFASRR